MSARDSRPVFLANNVVKYSAIVYFGIAAAGAAKVLSDFSSLPPQELIATASSVALVFVIGVRAVRGGILVTEDGIVSRNEVRTRKLPWTRSQGSASPASWKWCGRANVGRSLDHPAVPPVPSEPHPAARRTSTGSRKPDPDANDGVGVTRGGVGTVQFDAERDVPT